MTTEIASLPWLPRPPADFRQRCKELDPRGAASELRRLSSFFLDERHSHLIASALRRVSNSGARLEGLTRVRLAILSNSTTTFAAPAIVAAGLRYGLQIEVVEAEFSQVFQEALYPDSQLYRSKPDMVLLAMDHRGLPISPCPGEKETARQIVTRGLTEIEGLISAIRGNCRATVILQSIPGVVWPTFGNFDSALPGTLNRLISELNILFVERLIPQGILIADIANLAATVGIGEWSDPRSWNLAKIPFATRFLPLYADQVARVIGAAYGKSRKCLVLDLDNTIWGGVVGDDGIDKLVLANGHPTGEAYLEVQRAALALHSRGVVLAVCSKNEESIARAAFREHPEMLLRESHIAAFQANWEDKARNLRTIAERLGLGLEALVLLDDNAAERDLVRHALPEVAVPELPDDPAMFARTLLCAGYFESIAFTEDDRKRNEQYAANALRARLAEDSTDIESYLRSLDMTIEIGSFTQIDRQRIVQLINKTNQFNLTTRRYTEEDVKQLEYDPRVSTFQVRLRDRFGDNGLISVLICRTAGTDWIIDTWLMSCRVLKRRVEHAVLNVVVEEARSRGLKRIVGVYIPTARNGLVKNLFEELRFGLLDRVGLEESWALDVSTFVPFAVPLEVKRQPPPDRAAAL